MFSKTIVEVDLESFFDEGSDGFAENARAQRTQLGEILGRAAAIYGNRDRPTGEA